MKSLADSQDADGDLERAIALSLQSSTSRDKDRAVILISDSEDEDGSKGNKASVIATSSNPNKRKRENDDIDHDSSATELSDEEQGQPNLRAGSSSTNTKKRALSPASLNGVSTKKIRQDTLSSSSVTAQADSGAPTTIDAATSSSSTTFAGIDRAALERERLARQAAREAANSSASSSASLPTTSASTSSNTSIASQALANDNPMAERKARFATLASLAEKHGDTPSSSSTTKGKERQRDDAAPTSTSNDYNNNSRYGTLEGSKKRENDRNRKFWKGIVRPTASSRHSGYECFSFADVLGNVSLPLKPAISLESLTILPDT